MRGVTLLNLGCRSYAESWELQRAIFDRLVTFKRGGAERVDGSYSEDICEATYDGQIAADIDLVMAQADRGAGCIITVEHPAVYTLGKSGREENMLLSPERLAAIGATLYHIDRGGDITFHGEGQIVCYPILDLESIGIGLREYIDSLEQAVIDTIARYGVEGCRLEGASGVWVKWEGSILRKICAIGVRSSRYITMHGLALNVATDLSYFDWINPCGFTDKGVTSLESLGVDYGSVEEVRRELMCNLIKILNVKIYKK